MANESSKELPIVKESAQTQLVYADRVLNVGLGPAVSRLMFGIEVGPNNFNTTSVLVMPTSALIDAVEHIHKMLHDNSQKELLGKTADLLKAQIDSL